MAALDPGLLTVVILGGLAGCLASLVPGLHVNTVAALGLLATQRSLIGQPAGAVGLLAALGASTIVSIVPLVLLGVPEGEDAPALLPGQRLAKKGQTRQALAASARGSLTGLLLATLVALPLLELLTLPETPGLLTLAAPVVAAGALLVLVLSDGAGPVKASLLAGLAGLLGLLALDLPVASPLGLPATVLLPLFLGLFGLPALAQAARAQPMEPRRPTTPVPGVDQREEEDEGTGPLGPVLGSGLGLLAGLFPGFTTGPATAVAVLIDRGEDEAIIATTSAVNTAMAVTATVALHALGRTRTGVHAAQVALAVPTGTRAWLVGDLEALAAGAAVGLVFLAVGARVLPGLARYVPRLAVGLIVPWVALVLAFTGWVGLAVAAAGWAVARAGMALGCRRSLLMASLLVPTLARATGLG